MKRLTFLLCGLLVLCMASSVTSPLHAQSIIINEVFNSSTASNEWIELLVVSDNLDLRGYDIMDRSTSGTRQTPLVFTTNSLWSSVPKGTIIVIRSGTGTEDTDPSDRLLKINSNNTTYFSGNVFNIGGSSDAVQIRTTSDVHIFGVSWGAANDTSLPSPKVHFSSSSSSETAISFNEDTLPELTTTTNWTFNNASSTQGAGNNATNTAWITSLRALTDGAGTAVINPDTTDHDVTQNYELTYRRDPGVTITDMRIIVPSHFSWSHNVADVNYTNMTATPSVSGDTIYFNSLTLSADSTIISIANVTSPESTAVYSFRLQTKATSNYVNIASSLNVVVWGVAVDIATIKSNDANGVPLRNGQLVTVRGVVTVANEFGGPSFIQDNTGGMAIFGSTFSTAVSQGDEVVLSGLIQPFSGLFEIVNPFLHTILSTGNTVTPLVLTASQIANDGAGGLEQYEGLLVRVNNVTVSGSGNWAYQNYTLTDASGSTQVRIDNNTNLIGAAIPGSMFDVVAVVSQFQSSSPYIGGYQIQPRSTSDIYSEGPIISTAPYESDMTPTSFRMNWATVHEGTSRLRYGLTTAYELGILEPDNTLRTTHAVDVTGLTAATVYHVQAFSVASGDTSHGFDQLVSTSSPSGTTGTINVYFNKTVNTTLSYGENALGGQDLIAKLVARINAAQFSIDAALYSLSANSYGDVVANALVAAKNRGVTVRFIGEYDNIGSSHTILTNAGIPVINDRYDATWFGQGLMHNKFVVIDYNGGDPEDVWVWTGSWNVTQQGTATDRQNSIEIQDKAVAGAYTLEFNEMWGSSTVTPNASNSRFGGRKTDNTPHRFLVNGVPVEVYFSPSDKTTSQIQKTIEKAQSSLSASLLTFTRSDLATATITKKNAGKKARILMDNNTDTGNQFANLQTNGVDVHLAGGTGLLHHKYLLVDAEDPAGTPYTLTGSHNWSNSAENSNDENTVILQSARVANLYLQEFAARYYEAGGSDSIRLALAAGFTLSTQSINFDSVDIGSAKQDSFLVSNPGEGYLSVSSITSNSPRFTVSPTNATIQPSGSKYFVVTFAPTTVGLRTANLVIVHNSLGTPDTVAVQGVGVDTTTIVSVSADYKTGWNMVSVPLKVSSMVKDSVFPGASSLAFTYQGAYIYHTTLSYGTGYWLKYTSGQTKSFSGSPIAIDTFNLNSDWNMVGSIGSPVPVGAITQVPPGFVQSNYFAYDNGYSIADTIMPGHAYWVKTNVAGSLILSENAGAFAKADNALERLNKLEITDAAGNSTALYFGVTPGEGFSQAMYAMPPVPPSGAFDARFKNGMLVAVEDASAQGAKEYPVAMQGFTSPVTITWEVADKAKSYSINAGKNNAPIRMSGTGSARLSEAMANQLGLRIADKEIPEAYSLGQNFPNPFNPTTTVAFSLPKVSVVTLSVYNSLGQVVQSVVDQQQMDEGYHSVVINANGLSSGVYYYRFSAVAVGDMNSQFNETKSFTIIK